MSAGQYSTITDASPATTTRDLADLTTIEAQRRTLALIEFVIHKTQPLDRLRGQLNERQEKALLRMFKEGPEGLSGCCQFHIMSDSHHFYRSHYGIFVSDSGKFYRSWLPGDL